MAARIGIAVLAAACAVALGAGGAGAAPIPSDPEADGVEQYVGAPVAPRPIRARRIPRHPFMAPNGRSNIHNDAYQSDVYRQAGPVGRDMETTSNLQFRECASVTFDSRGRIVTICVGLDRPVLMLMDAETLEPLATMNLPPRRPGPGAFNDFSGGGYFYLDHRDRAVIPTADRHIYVVAQAPGPKFVVKKDFPLTGLARDDALISALPDWDGLIWFASRDGVVGTLNPRTGRVRTRSLKEKIGNSFAVDETGGVYIVTDAALYRFDASRSGRPLRSWRQRYPNIGAMKPGQTQAGSGTTPTVFGRGWVAITDNGDPMSILVYRRDRRLRRNEEGERPRRLVCRQRVLRQGAGATDQSLIAINRSLIVENNFGYSSVAATMNGGVTEPGIERVDVDRDGRGCSVVWHSDERSPSAVPKLSLRSGLVYTYTKPERSDDEDAWYLTALDFRTGRTAWRKLAGVGFGYNNNWSPVTIGRPGVAYVGVLGGITRFEDMP